MHMLNLLANITDQNLASQFLNDTNYNITRGAREHQSQMNSRYFNPSSPLAEAQKIADNYTAMKQRKPMVIEYYKRKPTSTDTSFIESVEMYINPQRLSIQHQKVKGKAYTRGGIFYHHWGDDNPIMSLSGTVGLAGMKGIEQLEKIYLNSGTLLKYGDIDLNRVNNGVAQPYKNIDFNNMSNIVDTVIASPNKMVIDTALEGVADRIKNAKIKAEEGQYKIVQKVLENLKNIMAQTKYQDAYREISNQIAQEASKTSSPQLGTLYHSAQQKIASNVCLKNLDINTKILMAFEMVLPHVDLSGSLDKKTLDAIIKSSNYNSGLTGIGFNIVENTLMDISSDIIVKTYDIANSQASKLNEYIQQIHLSNENWKVDREDSFVGWTDIADEIFDEYRPRMIFIYFEDRVYIGHFDSFVYNRVAETPLIQYEMRFTVVRQILMSSTGKRPTDVGSPMAKYFSSTANTAPNDSLEQSYAEYYKTRKAEAYTELLRLIDMITIDKSVKNSGLDATLFDFALTNDQIADINRKIEQLKPLATEWAQSTFPDKMDYYNAMINSTNFSWQQRLDYFALAKMTPPNPGVKQHVNKEYIRIKAVLDKELLNGPLSNERKNQIADWLSKISSTSGITAPDWASSLGLSI